MLPSLLWKRVFQLCFLVVFLACSDEEFSLVLCGILLPPFSKVLCVYICFLGFRCSWEVCLFAFLIVYSLSSSKCYTGAWFMISGTKKCASPNRLCSFPENCTLTVYIALTNPKYRFIENFVQQRTVRTWILLSEGNQSGPQGGGLESEVDFHCHSGIHNITSGTLSVSLVSVNKQTKWALKVLWMKNENAVCAQVRYPMYYGTFIYISTVNYCPKTNRNDKWKRYSRRYRIIKTVDQKLSCPLRNNIKINTKLPSDYQSSPSLTVCLV